MEKRHIVKTYDEELDLLKLKISEMGKKAHEQLARVVFNGAEHINFDSELPSKLAVAHIKQ